MSNNQQPELLPFGNPDAIEQPPRPDLTSQSTLRDAMAPFQTYMQQRALAANTITALTGDMEILIEYAGEEAPLVSLSTPKLERFMHYLEHERDVPCSPKSLYRRGTTLKVFFQWLADQAVLGSNPAADLVHDRPASPLPTVLSDEQIEDLLVVTRSMRDADESPDARPHLLVTLLLDTGIKKAECMRIGLQHIDLTDVDHPSVYIHYDKPRQRIKSRRLTLSPEWSATLQPYMLRYQPKTKLFECTGRNLEYVLHTLSTLADLPQKLTFETLRWTSAVRSYQQGMDEDRLRRRLGLSPISWRETLPVIAALAEPPL